MRICALSIEEPLASGRIPRPANWPAATSELVEVLQMAIELNYSGCSTSPAVQSNPLAVALQGLSAAAAEDDV